MMNTANGASIRELVGKSYERAQNVIKTMEESNGDALLLLLDILLEAARQQLRRTPILDPGSLIETMAVQSPVVTMANLVQHLDACYEALPEWLKIPDGANGETPESKDTDLNAKLYAYFAAVAPFMQCELRERCILMWQECQGAA